MVLTPCIWGMDLTQRNNSSYLREISLVMDFERQSEITTLFVFTIF